MNPRNRLLTAGRDSCGKGSLVAIRGNVLGTSTDLGGSIRILSSPCLDSGHQGFVVNERISMKSKYAGIARDSLCGQETPSR